MWEKDVHHLHSFYIMSTWNWRSRAFKTRVQRASLWTPQVPTNLVALKMDLDFVFNLIFESLKDIRSRKIRTDVKIQKRKLPSWEFYGGRVPSWLLKRLLWRVMYWKYIILCPSNNNLFLWVVAGSPSSYKNDLTAFLFPPLIYFLTSIVEFQSLICPLWILCILCNLTFNILFVA